MTRVTNFGIKRKYVQAGFSQDEQETVASKGTGKTTGTAGPSEGTETVALQDSSNPPPKKKRKRTPKSKRDGYAAQRSTEASAVNGEPAPPESAPASEKTGSTTKVVDGEPVLTRLQKKQKRNLARRIKVQNATEARRLKRIQKKNAETVCFACRAKGHAAKDCPSQKGDGGADESAKVGPSIGVCYRCNSKKHSLSRCKKPVNPENPLPYATCFVCNGKGHLASSCPQNKAKGIYPNGGSCKLCGDTSHLAKDCIIRQNVTDPTTVLGTGRDAGADEDDFHMFKRKTGEIDRDEKKESKLKEMLDIRTGALSGTVKPAGVIPQPKKKVVIFK